MPASAKLVACCLRRYMNNQNDMAWPSVARIAGECGLSERCVQGYLKLLCSEGWLVNAGNSNSGTVKYQANTPAKIAPPAESAPPQKTALPPAESAPELNNELNKSVGIGKPRFSPPSVDEVRAYCLTKCYDIDAETFVAWNQSKGWKVGNQPMKCWKSALTTWALRRSKDGRDSKGSTGSVQQNRHQTTADKLRAKLAAATDGGRI